MNDKVLAQLLDRLRDAPLTSPARLELALQAAAWAKLSQGPGLPERMRLSREMILRPEALSNAFDLLGESEGLLGQAFIQTSFRAVGAQSVRYLLELALQLAETGVLNRFDPSDAIVHSASKQLWGWSLPPEIASFLVELAEIHEGESVYLPWDTGGQLAARATAKGANAYVEATNKSPVPALVSLILDRAFEIRFGEPVREPAFVAEGHPRKFDVSVAFPSLGERYLPDVAHNDWFNRFPERTQSGSVLAVRHLLSQAKRRVVVAVSNSFLFSSGAEHSLRDYLVRNGMVRSVIAMPAGLLESTNIAFTVLVLEPAGGLESVHFIDADEPNLIKPLSKARFALSDPELLSAIVRDGVEGPSSRLVSNNDILANEVQLQVSRYLVSESAKRVMAKVAAAETVALGELVKTIRPAPLSKDGDGIEAGEIGAADLPPHGYITGPSRTVRLAKAEKSAQAFLQPRDIMFILKGSVGKVGIVPDTVPKPGPGGWVAGQSAIVLRCDSDQIDPRALALQLRSAFGQELISQIRSGATIPLIQLRELLALPVLVPDRETTDAAIAALTREGELQEQIKGLNHELSGVAADLWPA